MRIQKILAVCGVGSRRYCDKLVEEGRVTANGRPVVTGQSFDIRKTLIAVDKVVVNDGDTRQLKRYIMLYKPRGYVTTMNDEQDRKCVADLVKELPERVYPVGRLDKNSEGLLIMTNDGALANQIMHPSTHVPKKYRVTVSSGLNDAQLSSLAEGIEIDSGKTAPALVKVLENTKTRSVMEITLYEGKNRQIRKMCEALGLTVSRLKRTAVGNVKLGMLRPGQFRELTLNEVKMLTKTSAEKRARKDGEEAPKRTGKNRRDNPNRGERKGNTRRSKK